MNGYKGWTKEQRLECQNRMLDAIRRGEIPDSSELPCEICGDTSRRHHYHCTNYDRDKAMSSLHPLCWMCHINLHSIEIGPSSQYYQRAEAYFQRLRYTLNGKKMPMPIPEYGKEWEKNEETSD